MELDAIMNISKIENIDFSTFCKLLSSQKISEEKKIHFVRKNKTKILEAMKIHLTTADFQKIIKNRPLQKFRPLKNSFTKAGDKILLAQTLNIQPSEVPAYIKNVKNSMEAVKNLNFISQENFDAIKTYVYRHGSKDDLVAFLDMELKKVKDIETFLYQTLSYNAGGVADYFTRPIHAMDNKTLVKLYNIINENINIAHKNGDLSKLESQNIAQWTLIRIYKIQNNSKLLNAIKSFKTLS